MVHFVLLLVSLRYRFFSSLPPLTLLLPSFRTPFPCFVILSVAILHFFSFDNSPSSSSIAYPTFPSPPAFFSRLQRFCYCTEHEHEQKKRNLAHCLSLLRNKKKRTEKEEKGFPYCDLSLTPEKRGVVTYD